MLKGLEFFIYCQSCSFSYLCLFVFLNKIELDLLDDIIECKKLFYKYDKLVKVGDIFMLFYVVCVGLFKLFVSSKDGEE